MKTVIYIKGLNMIKRIKGLALNFQKTVHLLYVLCLRFFFVRLTENLGICTDFNSWVEKPMAPH